MRKFKDGDHVVIVYSGATNIGKQGYVKVDDNDSYTVVNENGKSIGRFVHDTSLEHTILHDSPLMKALR